MSVPPPADLPAGPPTRARRPRALVSRPEAEDPICRALSEAGLDVVAAALTVTRPASAAVRRGALDALRGAAWVAVTSPTAVRVLRSTAEESGTTLAAALRTTPHPSAGRADEAGAAVRADEAASAAPDRPASHGVRVAAVGRGTARALEAAGVHVDLVPAPEAENAAGLVAAFPDPPPAAPFPTGGIPAGPASPLRAPIRPDRPARTSDGPATRVADPARHVVLPASALASPTLAQGLRARGWEVTAVPIYTTAPVDGPAAAALHAAVGDPPDVVVLTAGSGARAMVEILGRPPAGTAVAVIGEPTARVCAELGIRVDAVAATPAPADLAAAALAALSAAAPGQTPLPPRP